MGRVPATSRSPVALVVLRCWSEDGTREGFRAHLTVVKDITDEAVAVSYAASPAEVLETVTALMAEVQHTVPAPPPPDAAVR